MATVLAKKYDDLDALIMGIPKYDPYHNAEKFKFDYEAAQLAIDFWPEFLTHVKGEWAGNPFVLEDWQKAIIANLFGWKDDNGFRRYRRVLQFVPRKNGKSPFGAGLICQIYHTDDEKGMEIYSAASESDQASLVFNTAKQMMLNDIDLSKNVTAQRYSIFKNHDPLSVYRYISADAKSKHGYNTHLAVIDELHVCERDLIEVFDTSISARRQPLIVYLTTSDYERESICNEVYDYSKNVLSGTYTNPRFLPIIYEASKEDDWKDPDVWYKANPNLGISKKLDYMETECQKAIDSPMYLNSFLRLDLNVKTEQATRFFNMDLYDACCEELPDLRGKPCFGGLDLSSTLDVTAFSLVFPLDDGAFAVLLLHGTL